MSEELVSKMNQGHQAQVCLNWLGPIFEECENAVVVNLKHAYRSGKFTETVLASGVASLCTLEDLKSRLSGLVRQGDGAHKALEEGVPNGR